MKKKMLAILLSAAMVVCLMPTMAFATVEDAKTEEVTTETKNSEEEVKEEATEEAEEKEEPIVEATKEANPSVEAKTNGEEETAELSTSFERSVVGTWDGYKYSCTVQGKDKLNDESVETVVKVDGKDRTVDALKGGIFDLTDIVNDVFAKGADYCEVVIKSDLYGSEEGGDYHQYGSCVSESIFVKFDINVNVDKASTKDTIFYYDMPYALEDVNSYTETNALKKSTISEAFDKRMIARDLYLNPEHKYNNQLVSDSIKLAAGTTSTSGRLVFRHSEEVFGGTDGKEAYSLPVGFVFQEKSNDGGYTIDTSVYAAISKEYLNAAPKDLDPLYFMKRGFKYAKFADMDTLDKNIASLNSDYENNIKLLSSVFTEDHMTFNHTAVVVEKVKKSASKGVNTGDSNELGLWVVMGIFASVAAAAYALKRREN